MREHPLANDTAIHSRALQTRSDDELSLCGNGSGFDTPLGVKAPSSDSEGAGLHATALNRATGSRLSRAQSSLLRLQRQMGNRYVQRMLALARQGEGESDVTPEVEASIEQSRGGGQGLDSRTRLQMESAFGADFGGVRIHTGAGAHSLNRAVNAVAFTTGRDIFFRDGAYNPGNAGGKELLAHELTHVVQQGGAAQISGIAQRVTIQRICPACEEEKGKNPFQAKLVVGQPDDQYEQEAERIAKVVVNTVDANSASSHHASGPVQRQCACGETLGQEKEECAECRMKRLALQHLGNLNAQDFRKNASEKIPEDKRRDIFSGKLHEEDAGAGDDFEPDVEFLYQNGTTTCVFPGGTPSSVINNNNCSRPCTVRHEGVHAADIGPCCAQAGVAYSSASSDAERTSIRSSFFGWMSGNRSWFECRGYAESVACADEMLATNNCANQSSQCCSDLASYRASMEASRVANCAAAGTLSDCPF